MIRKINIRESENLKALLPKATILRFFQKRNGFEKTPATPINNPAWTIPVRED